MGKLTRRRPRGGPRLLRRAWLHAHPRGLSFEPPDAGSKRSGRSKEVLGHPAAAEEDWGQREVGGGGSGGV
jgi:hypothetical protein